MEGVNVKDLTPSQIPEAIGLVVCDISFVSLTKVLAAPLSLAEANAEAVLLIKPQFEVGRDNVGRGGIVSDETAIAEAVAHVIQFMAEQGWAHRLSIPSPIAGGDGNKEIVALFRRVG